MSRTEMPDRIVVPVSGGKDSQAALKLAVNEFGADSVVGLFCNTGWEHPLTYAHIDRIAMLYQVKVYKIRNDRDANTVPEQIIKYRRFPGGGARFCTDELKIAPGKRWYTRFAEQNGGFQIWCGVRAGESAERSKRYAGKVCDELMAPHEFMSGKYPKYMHDLGITIRLPIVDWSSEDVFEYLNGEHNPLYDQGFERVGCFPCLAAGDAWKKKAFEHDEFGRRAYERVKSLEPIVGRSIFTSKKMADCGCEICAI